MIIFLRFTVDFVQALAEDSAVWEILGVREVSFFDNGPESIALEFFCFSQDPINGLTERLVKSFHLPFTALIHILPGSSWQHGRQISKNLRWRKMRIIDPRRSQIIKCRKHYTTEDIKAKISLASNPHRSFMALTNYVLCRGPFFKVRIPCAELIRHFMCPTKRYAKMIIKGEFGIYANSNHPYHPPAGLTHRESETTEFLLSSRRGLRAARYPYKMLKISRILTTTSRQHIPLLLSALLPTENEILIRMAAICDNNSDTLAIQLHRSTRVLDPN